MIRKAFFRLHTIPVSIICFFTSSYIFATQSDPHNNQCYTPLHKSKKINSDMVWIKAGTFTMGNNSGHTDKSSGRFEAYPEEHHVHEVTVDGFWIDRHEVTNQQFSEFVNETGYITIAEKTPKKEWYPINFPKEKMIKGSAVFKQPENISNMRDISQWWQFIEGADWQHPQGPESNIKGKMDHPVVHVTYEDASAYSAWAGNQLPTEAQWEFAARGGLQNQPYSWGEKYRKNNKWMANTWQGEFPVNNSPEDGYAGTAPIGCYSAMLSGYLICQAMFGKL